MVRLHRGVALKGDQREPPTREIANLALKDLLRAQHDGDARKYESMSMQFHAILDRLFVGQQDEQSFLFNMTAYEMGQMMHSCLTGEPELWNEDEGKQLARYREPWIEGGAEMLRCLNITSGGRNDC